MNYLVRSLDGGMRLVFRDNGVTRDWFDSVLEAKMMAVAVGMSFEVVEAEAPFRRMCSGIKSPVGFLMEELDERKVAGMTPESGGQAAGLQA